MIPVPAQFTILANDKPSAGRCSRCGAQDLGPRQVAAIWNGAEYAYCSECRLKMEAAEAERRKKAAQCR